MRFLISSNPDNLQAEAPHATVEAEYGDRVVTGSILTMAHHGPRAGAPAPCSYPNNPAEGIELVGLSHVDLDSLGGCAALLGRKPDEPSFWALAEFVDLNGAHKLGSSEANESDLAALHAYWAWSKENRVFAPRDGSVLDVSCSVLKGIETVEKILDGDVELLEAGEAFRQADDTLNRESFKRWVGGNVILRQSAQFTNHLYGDPKVTEPTRPNGHSTAARGCVTHNPAKDTPGGAITISLADPIAAVSCGEILKGLFGPEAGGHAGIGGSERGKPRPFSDAEEAAYRLDDAIVVGLARAEAIGLHGDQKRSYSGDPYFVHLDEVADLVRENGGDTKMIVAAYFHDVIEDCSSVDVKAIRQIVMDADIGGADFGAKVGCLVEALTDHFTVETFPSLNRGQRKQKECARYAEESGAVRLIKSADLISNLNSCLVEGYEANSGDINFAEKFVAEASDLGFVLNTVLGESLARAINKLEWRIKPARQARAERKAAATK